MPLFLVLTWLSVVFGAAGAMLQLTSMKRNPHLALWARACFVLMAFTIITRMIIMFSS